MDSVITVLTEDYYFRKLLCELWAKYSSIPFWDSVLWVWITPKFEFEYIYLGSTERESLRVGFIHGSSAKLEQEWRKISFTPTAS